MRFRIRLFAMMRMRRRIQIMVSKMMRIHAYPDLDVDHDPQHWLTVSFFYVSIEPPPQGVAHEEHN